MASSTPNEPALDLPDTGTSSIPPPGSPEKSAAGATNFGQDILQSLQAVSSNHGDAQPQQQQQQHAESSQLAAKTGAADGNGDVGGKAAANTDARQDEHISEAKGEDGGAGAEEAIGPASDKPLFQSLSTAAAERSLVITLLLHSTDTRHPYIINEAYLKRRNVDVEESSPVNMTVYTLKELILRDWRQEWQSKPTSPSSIRLIHMGRMLDDKAYLRDSRFSLGEAPHIVHMTIKPQEVIDDEDARIAKGGRSDRQDGERGSGCRCIIM